MTSKRKLFVWSSFAALMLATLACSPALPGSNAGPTPTLYVIPTTSPDQLATLSAMAVGGTGNEDDETIDEGSDEPVDGGDKLDYQAVDTSEFDSYRSEFTMSWSGTDEEGNPVEGSYTATQAYTRDPVASYVEWHSTATAVPNASFVSVQIGDASYFLIGEEGGEPQCITSTQDGTELAQDPPFSPDTWMSSADLSNAQRVLPDEMVNGVMARHYRMTETETTVFAGFSSYQLDVWIAQDGEYPVREMLVGDGAFMGFSTGQGHIEWTYNLTDVNGPVIIDPPAGCEMPGGGDFPMMGDAAEVGSIGNTILSYTTASPIADVVAFYNGELPGMGWEAGTAMTDTPGFATMEFTRGEERVTITITEGDGNTSVLISFGE